MLIKDGNTKQQKELFEKQLYREVPSQLPFTLTKASFHRALSHGVTVTEGNGPGSVFRCKTTGAPMKVKVVLMNVFNDDASLNATGVPVGVAYCKSCDKVPAIHKDMPIYARDIQTVSL